MLVGAPSPHTFLNPSVLQIEKDAPQRRATCWRCARASSGDLHGGDQGERPGGARARAWADASARHPDGQLPHSHRRGSRISISAAGTRNIVCRTWRRCPAHRQPQAPVRRRLGQAWGDVRVHLARGAARQFRGAARGARRDPRSGPGVSCATRSTRRARRPWASASGRRSSDAPQKQQVRTGGRYETGRGSSCAGALQRHDDHSCGRAGNEHVGLPVARDHDGDAARGRERRGRARPPRRRQDGDRSRPAYRLGERHRGVRRHRHRPRAARGGRRLHRARHRRQSAHRCAAVQQELQVRSAHRSCADHPTRHAGLGAGGQSGVPGQDHRRADRARQGKARCNRFRLRRRRQRATDRDGAPDGAQRHQAHPCALSRRQRGADTSSPGSSR